MNHVAIPAIEVDPGDLVRMPESASSYLVTEVRTVTTDEGAFHVVLDAGWGTCELSWRTLVDRVEV